MESNTSNSENQQQTISQQGETPPQDNATPSLAAAAHIENATVAPTVITFNDAATLPLPPCDDIPPPKPDFFAPPPYDMATKLPTYEEVQREKHLEGSAIPGSITQPPRPLEYIRAPRPRILTIDADTTDDIDTSLLGTDFTFYVAFFVAFIFNWIGFLLLMCFCHTIASRYGALSGFGLSLAKWTLIVQHSTDLASKDNSWLWWLIMTFGLIICIRAILQYLSIKRGWHMLSASHQERLLFFY